MDQIFYPSSNGIPSAIPSESKLATYMVINQNINSFYPINIHNFTLIIYFIIYLFIAYVVVFIIIFYFI